MNEAENDQTSMAEVELLLDFLKLREQSDMGPVSLA